MTSALRHSIVAAFGLALFGCGASSPASKSPTSASAAGRNESPALQRAFLEIDQLEKMAAATPVERPERAMIVRRIAETYYAIQAYEERALAAGATGDDAEDAVRVCVGARKHVEERYEELLAKYPSYPQRDEVTFFLAGELLPHCAARPAPRGLTARASRARAVATYRRLLADSPSSKYASAARLGIAEVLFDEASEGTTPWADVLEAYRSIVESTESSAHPYAPYALYKEGFVYQHLGECAKAHDAFEKAIALIHDDPAVAKGKSAGLADECAQELAQLATTCP